ncbi:hypothetical protein BOTNAR_0006g00780 [Botryotinia narcissicola]|uniref:Uncharacterized protein n=1 Tax=Botryotinia narcissicola TaxID=278944 RepID=A0A4Z1J847_9HELO|nr:hypothetical protein BOTNAR_0006g00780 [Botryotinia narcissicola]
MKQSLRVQYSSGQWEIVGYDGKIAGCQTAIRDVLIYYGLPGDEMQLFWEEVVRLDPCSIERPNGKGKALAVRLSLWEFS